MTARAASALLLLLGSACAQVDVVAYRALGTCTDGRADGGACDAPPDAGTCAATTCPSPLRCDRPVPTAILGDGCGEQAWAAPAFRHALCSCGDFVSEHALTVQGDGGAIAVDGTLTSNGRITAPSALYVAGALEVAAENLAVSAALGQTAQARCDCSRDVVLDPAAVRALAPPGSAPSGFDPLQLEDVRVGDTVALSCGRYRVERIAGPSDLQVSIEGHVVIVVEGDVALDGGFEAQLADGALLELYVLGNLRVAGALLLGDDARRATVRLTVLGSGTIDLAAEAFIAGPLYAPSSELVTRGPLTAEGAIFVRRAAPGERVLVRYDMTSASADVCAAL